ncbi:MAG TPA: hypothetical protein PK156_40280, partial [Polyangium sp.]|nr:hypothetical protein [Polyangium sp.]
QAGLAVNARVPKEAMDVLEAALIVLVAVATRVAAKEDAAKKDDVETNPPADKPVVVAKEVTQ